MDELNEVPNYRINESKVNAVVELDKQSLFYRVELTPEEASLFAERREVFYGDLCGLLSEIDKVMPVQRWGAGNPLNGKFAHKYWIGREYSRVVYLELIETYYPRGTNLLEALEQACKIAEGFGVNEIHVTKEKLSYKVRLCWV